MMMKNKILIIIIAFFTSSFGFSQEKMSLNQAILKALENNRNIKISKNSVIISENLSSLGQAGLLPSLNATSMVDYGNDNMKVQAVDSPTAIETSGVESQLYNASLNLNYTIFSGFANKHTYEKLKTNIELADAESNVFIENIILQVAANYYNVIRTKQNYDALLSTIEISKKRYELAKARNDYSGGTRLALLNVKVDLNKDSVTLYDAKLAMENAKLAFNKVVGDSLEIEINLINEFSAENNYNYEELKQKMFSQNFELLSLKHKEQVSLLDYKIAKSSLMPTLNFGSSYSYAKTDSENSAYDLYRTNGFGANLSLSIPIYNGGRKKAVINNTKILIENSALQIEELSLQLEMELLSAYKDYQNSLEKVKMEKINVETAKLNFELSEEKYKMGQVSNTEFRLAQLNLLVSENSYNNSVYNTQLAELEIIKLSGVLLNRISE